MRCTLAWLDSPEGFEQAPPAERHDHLRAALGAAHGESCVATTFRLKPDGAFTVLHLHAGVSLEGSLLAFSDEVVRRFTALAEEIYSDLSDSERREIERLAAAKEEIGAAHGATPEELAMTVPSLLVGDVKQRIEALFESIGDVLIEV